VHRRFASSYLSTSRDVIVYLPPGYDDQTRSRYPVLYMQDGQNLFDPATAFMGNHWRLGETADALIAEGRIAPLIIAGVYNAGVRRISEYTPTRCRRLRKGGKAERYAQMLARELKPFIDHEYRTRKAAAHTGVGGSSLGALVSLTAVLAYPAVFGAAALLSPSVWWDNRAILRSVEAFQGRPRARIWLDTGTEEGETPEENAANTRMLRDALVAKGWRGDQNLHYREVRGAGHNEREWGARFGEVLQCLYPAE
jgi:predicted alpha/beta superfamily hydrolase